MGANLTKEVDTASLMKHLIVNDGRVPINMQRSCMDTLSMPDRLSVRVRAEDRELLNLAARRNRMRLSEFVRQAALRAAANTVSTADASGRAA